jgi:hypothetical protein
VVCVLISRTEGQDINIYKVIDFEKLAISLSLFIDLFTYSSFNDVLISITGRFVISEWERIFKDAVSFYMKHAYFGGLCWTD